MSKYSPHYCEQREPYEFSTELVIARPRAPASGRGNPGVKILDLSGISVFISHPYKQQLIVSSYIFLDCFARLAGARRLAMTGTAISVLVQLLHRGG